MIEWKTLGIDDSIELFEQYKTSKTFSCPEAYSELRNDLCQAFSQTLAELGIGPEMISTKNYACYSGCGWYAIWGKPSRSILEKGQATLVKSSMVVYSFIMAR